MKREHHAYRTPTQHECGFSSADAKYLGMALDGLGHYHISHTQDTVTRFMLETVDEETPRIIHIYITSDPEARKEFAALAEKHGIKQPREGLR